MPNLSDKIDALVNDLPLEAIDKGWLAIQIEELVKAETPQCQPVICEHCMGHGEYEHTIGGNGESDMDVVKQCPHCDGTGYMIDITAFSSIGSTAYNVHMYLRNSLPKILEARDVSP